MDQGSSSPPSRPLTGTLARTLSRGFFACNNRSTGSGNSHEPRTTAHELRQSFRPNGSQTRHPEVRALRCTCAAGRASKGERPGYRHGQSPFETAALRPPQGDGLKANSWDLGVAPGQTEPGFDLGDLGAADGHAVRRRAVEFDDSAVALLPDEGDMRDRDDVA